MPKPDAIINFDNGDLNSAEIGAIIADVKALTVLHPGKRIYKHDMMTPGRNPNDIELAWLSLKMDGIIPRDDTIMLDPNAVMHS